MIENKENLITNEKKENLITKEYEAIYLGGGRNWVEGEKNGKHYAFATFGLDFKILKQDGNFYIKRVDITINDKELMPSADIEEYKPVLVKFAMPSLPTYLPKFVGIVKNL